MTPQILAAREFFEFLAAYFVQRKLTPFCKMYRLTRSLHGAEQLRTMLSSILRSSELVDGVIACGESLTGTALEQGATA